MSAASLRGFSVSRPFGDSDRYDVAVEHGGRFIRVQVKSTSSSHGDRKGYICCAYGSRFGGHTAYAPEDVDILAVYVIPRDVWYLFPPAIFSNRFSIYLRPDLPQHRYQPYREAWHLLTEIDARTNKEEVTTTKPPAQTQPRTLHKPARRCEDCFYGPNNVGDIHAIADTFA